MKIARRAMKADVPSMAMGDIAFNLLIFFVILARPTDDNHLKWEPASSDRIKQAKNYRTSIVIDKDRKVYVAGQPIAESQLKGRLTDELKGATTEAGRTVLLKIHKETPAASFEPVIEAVSEAGGVIIHVLETKQEEK